MNKLSFYPKLAWINIKKNGKIYFPYILTCIGTIMMFYNMCAITWNDGVKMLQGAALIQSVLSLGIVVIAIFAVIFLFYTNSFLMKRRKKEIGLYNVLGMGKRHIAKMMFCETMLIAFISLILGIGIGVVINKLMFLLLLKLMGETNIPFGFQISYRSLKDTLALFGAIFVLILCSNLWRIRLSRPIELLHGDQTGEHEPKTKIIMTIIGVVTLVAGYYLALHVQGPMDAIGMFFVAVICVIIGTYALFTAGSIALLKILRKNKTYYYKTNHFVSVSSMIYRMKQNAVGLANICILSTMVLVMLSSTVSLYGGMEEAIQGRFLRQVQVEVGMEQLNQIEMIQKDVQTIKEQTEGKTSNLLSYYYLEEIMLQKENRFEYQAMMTMDKSYYVMLIPVSQYEKIVHKKMDLKNDEIYYYSKGGKELDGTITIMDMNFHVAGKVDRIENSTSAVIAYDSYFMIIDDDVVEQLREKLVDASKQEEKSRKIAYNYYIGVDAKEEDADEVIKSFETTLEGNDYSLDVVENIYESSSSLKGMYGGFFFLGLFLGSLFLMATVLIIYYKQISEGYEDQKRFEIMKKVGMNRKEIKSAIGSQVLIVFFLPLVTACIHIAFAFPMISKMLQGLGLMNITVFMWCTVFAAAIFAVIYAIVYIWTAREYYKIVQTAS